MSWMGGNPSGEIAAILRICREPFALGLFDDFEPGFDPRRIRGQAFGIALDLIQDGGVA